jgi:subtilisin family serine protease
MRVLAGEEQAAVDVLSRRSDVEFASVDTIQTRQFTPTDANLSFQWHHGSVDSFGAWEAGIGNGTVAVAIVDTAFQMNHPDLIQNVETGWDVVDEMPILTSAGEVHSTATAGMAGAVINNGVGVAGATNCRLVPVGITGATSEMYQAVLWAADHSIRVVNISWTGADDPVLQAAGEYLEARVQGVLVMPGLNSTGQAGFVNHSNIVCISMTDAADNVRSLSGPHIDFAAPGWDVYTTTINSTYATARGTSFAAPFFSGIVAMVMSINPALTAAQVIDVMRETADDKGHSGWDESYGWGRVNFRSAVEKTVTTLPRISSVTARSSRLEIAVQTAYPFYLTLERKDLIPESGWTVVSNQHSLAEITIFEDRSRSAAAMYRVRAEPARD